MVRRLVDIGFRDTKEGLMHPFRKRDLVGVGLPSSQGVTESMHTHWDDCLTLASIICVHTRLLMEEID